MGAKVALAVLLAAVAGGGPQTKHVRADQARARAIVLTPADLGAGWKSERSSGSVVRFRCPGFEPDESDLVETGHADSAGFFRDDGASVNSGASVYRTAGEAEAGWARTVRPGLVRCLSSLVRGQTTTVDAAGAIGFPQLATRTAALRVIASFGERRTAGKLVVDLVLLGHDRANAAVLVTSVDQALPAAAERRLASLVARRLARAFGPAA
jgi:hypothetical protein